MGTRAHAVVVVTTVSLTALLNTGCFFFGGGGKKDKPAKAPHASAAAAPQMSASEAAIAAAPQLPATGAPIDPQTIAAKQARDKALAEALAPRDSAVAWPKADELRISPNQPARPEAQPTPEPEPAAPHAVVPAPRAPQRAAKDGRAYAAPQPQAPTPTLSHEDAPAGGQPQAVANAGLAITDVDLTADTPDATADARPAAAQDSQQSRGPVRNDELSRRIAQRLRDNPGDLATQLDHQLLRFLSDDSVPDLNTLSPLPAEDRELLTAIMDGLVNFRNGVRADQNMLLSRKVRPLLEMAARLRSQAELSIPTIALCQKVERFGTYVPMDGRFIAGVVNPTIVYCEVGNVSSQQDERGIWGSTLSQEVVLFTEAGVPVWTSKRLVVNDESRNRRQDFFVGQKIFLPANLSIARYILKVTVTDEQVKRVAEATVPITIVAAVDQQQQHQPQQSPPQAPNPPQVGPGVAGPAHQGASRAGDDARTAAERQAPSQPGLNVTRTSDDPADGK